MRRSMLFLATASALAVTAPAHAATFVFSSGSYVPGTTSPSPLLSPDVLEINTGANKLFAGVTFTNQSGTVNWNDGALFLSSASQLINQSLWNATGDDSLNFNGGAQSIFNNSGIFRKSVGLGVTTIGSIAFVNSGTIDAQTGTISFGGGNATFNAGSIFTGAGQVDIGTSTFNGGFTSSNVDFEGGTFTGNAAALTGTAEWNGGTFAGGWTVNSGSTLTAATGANKLFAGVTFTNDGTIDWAGGSSFYQSGTQLINNGLIDFAASSSLNSNGGAVSTITNNASGVFQVDAGATVTMNNTFVNNGGTITTDGTFNFNNGTATFNDNTIFNGSGTNAINNNAAFNGDISSGNLSFNGGTFTGGAAILDGTADWAGGTFSGDWTLTSGSTLTALTGANKLFSNATFTNNGTMDWTGGSSFYQSGTQLINNGLIDFAASSSLNFNGGAVSTITNNASGVFHVDAGQTVTMNNTFVNNGGTITADGTFAFNNGTATFNAGTVFNGSGTNAINNNAAFNGAFSSTNVDFNGGTFTGTGAALSGAADWASGTFTGGWNIVSGATMTMLTGANKLLSAANFTNNGNIGWQDGAVFVSSATQIVNNGTITATGDDSINFNGGAPSNLVNNGLIEKTGGAGTTTLANGIGLDNNGTINVLSGTIGLPSAFSNDGTLGGTGTFLSTNLTNNGIIAPGAPGATGTLNLTGNYLQTASGFLNTQLASTGSFDLFRVSGTGTLGGTLNLSCIFTCAINTGDSFIIFDSFAAMAGTFANVTTSGFLNGFSYNLVYDYAGDNVRLDITNAGTAGPGPGAVPEPATWAMMLLGFGVIGSALRRRRTTKPSFI